MPGTQAGHVFISYSRRDDVVMHRIVSHLRGQGIRAWVDNEKLVPGTPIWEVEIEKAIKGSFALVVILSPDSKRSEWVRREITLADQFRKRVFPVLVGEKDEDSIPLRLITRQFVDIRTNEAEGLMLLSSAISSYIVELEYLEDVQFSPKHGEAAHTIQNALEKSAEQDTKNFDHPNIISAVRPTTLPEDFKSNQKPRDLPS